MNSRQQLADSIWGKYKEAYPTKEQIESSRYASAYRNRGNKLPSMEQLKKIALHIGLKVEEEYRLVSIEAGFILDNNIPLEHKLSLRGSKNDNQ